ncbi:phage baseplate assembly protein V [Paenibacillus sp. GCM10012307]|uniref:Gp5/Type VI secretion system Vgr protein OB-fold domain-containing protein n=1 Tax=Paenibacillus roseus TaxID=2798579 RepID=A0A934J800_9BACL|nr:phage baseplate assembly protein V [Paenibacillus roseus]MBJ6362092.1 hypothetical protein [Paenibacillus roseus]
MDIIRIGEVSDVDEDELAIRVTFPDREDQVSDWLTAIMPPIELNDDVRIQMPEIGDAVLCVFLGNGIETGFFLGTIGVDEP